MNNNDILRNIRVASPCPANWDEMTGDDRQRFCAKCQKHVYNFSEMTSDEVVRLVRETEERLCGQFYRREDGTILTSDCPNGIPRFTRRVKRVLCASAALGAMFVLTAFSPNNGGANHSLQSQEGRFSRLFNNKIEQVKNWFVVKKPKPTPLPPEDRMIKGEIILPEPRSCPVPNLPPRHDK